jgi:hypothetical protein
MSTILTLVINESQKDTFEPYAEKYKVFSQQEDAITFAKEKGWKEAFGMGFNPIPGVKCQYACGDVDVSIMNIELN